MQRRVEEELLDGDLGTTREIAAALVDLKHINDWFGGTRTSIQLVTRIARSTGQRALSLLEVGAGAGDVPATVGRKLAGKGFEVKVVLLDRMANHLPVNTPAVAGDALRLPFSDDSFDVVSSSLLVHHFEPTELARFAREALRVARYAVMINDLIRSPLHLALTYLGLPLFRSHLTWHDAPASVRRAYTRAEMRQIVTGLPAHHIEISARYLYRMGVLLWK